MSGRRAPARRRPPGPGAGPDRDTLLRATRLFLEGIGDPDLASDLRRTPKRVADAWAGEILSGYASRPDAILGGAFRSPDRGMVVVRDIPFVSVCVHHLLPFHGRAHVGYLPGGRIVGLSKLARLVDAFSRRLQLQERLTRQVTAALDESLSCLGAACRMEAEHLCMTLRGARKEGAMVVTTSFTGSFAGKPSLRSEFLRLCSGSALPR